MANMRKCFNLKKNCEGSTGPASTELLNLQMENEAFPHWPKTSIESDSCSLSQSADVILPLHCKLHALQMSWESDRQEVLHSSFFRRSCYLPLPEWLFHFKYYFPCCLSHLFCYFHVVVEMCAHFTDFILHLQLSYIKLIGWTRTVGLYLTMMMAKLCL